MASRTLVRWWGWVTGKPPRAEVMRKWLYTEDAPEVYPLVAATSFGAIMAVSAMAYQLIYNPSILCATARELCMRARSRRTRDEPPRVLQLLRM